MTALWSLAFPWSSDMFSGMSLADKYVFFKLVSPFAAIVAGVTVWGLVSLWYKITGKT